jgi:hypothetical protein
MVGCQKARAMILLVPYSPWGARYVRSIGPTMVILTTSRSQAHRFGSAEFALAAWKDAGGSMIDVRVVELWA